MGKSVFKRFGKMVSVLLVAMIFLSVCFVGVFAVGENVSAASKISVYVCDFENGSYGNVSEHANTGSIETDENGNNYFRFEAPTDLDTYRFEVYNSAAGELTLKEGNFYCVSVKYKVENISSAKASDLGTSINVARQSDIKGKLVKIKGMTGVNYMPGNTTDWITQSIIFKATLSGDGNANRLAINVTSPTCGSSTPERKALVSVILMDDITVYECKGTTSALDLQVNGGSFCEPILAQAGEEIALPTPTRKNYDFGGWFADAKLSKPFTSKTMPSSLLTRVYAKWVISDTAIRVDFDCTGGVAVEPLVGEEGAPISLPKTTRQGFNFGGWYNADFTEKYTATTFPSDDATLYAKWEPIAVFAGFENADEYGSPNNNSFTKRCKILKGTKATGEYSLYYDFDQGVASSTSTYKTWAGVQLLDECNEKYEVLAGQKYKVTFKYKIIEVTEPGDIGVILSAEKGCWSGGRVTYNNEKKGDQWVKYDESDIGKGWQEGSFEFTARHVGDYGFVAIGISGHSKLCCDDFVITPVDERFPASNKCMISFETNSSQLIDSIYGDYGEGFVLPKPEREGYEFVGWFTDTAFESVFHERTFARMYTKVYADWIEAGTQSGESDGDADVTPNEDDSKEFDPIIIIIIVAAVVVVGAIVFVVLFVAKKNKKLVDDGAKEEETESKEE